MTRTPTVSDWDLNPGPLSLEESALLTKLMRPHRGGGFLGGKGTQMLPFVWKGSTQISPIFRRSRLYQLLIIKKKEEAQNGYRTHIGFFFKIIMSEEAQILPMLRGGGGHPVSVNPQRGWPDFVNENKNKNLHFPLMISEQSLTSTDSNHLIWGRGLWRNKFRFWFGQMFWRKFQLGQTK